MFNVNHNGFELNGQPFIIRSGTIHYFRNMPDTWKEKLIKLKAAGLNTVETYVCWNLVEKERGQFDFSGMNDVVSFLKMAQEVGLYAIVRPGPYICAEINGGGVPWWLLVDEQGNKVDAPLRCSAEPYFSAALCYYHRLLPMLVPLLETHGGPILMMQVENEYGAYGNDHVYLDGLVKEMRDDGIDVPLFTSDSPWKTNFSGGNIDGCLYTLNFGSKPEENFSRLDAIKPDQAHMNTEFWVGWFGTWGKKRVVRELEDFRLAFDYYLKHNDSFNMCVFIGGTNFGETAGANCADAEQGGYMPTITSYDYDALLSEWGGYTPKYYLVREELFKLQNKNPGDDPLPPEPKLQNIGIVPLTESCDPWKHGEIIGETRNALLPLTFEEMNLGGGYVKYTTRLTGPYEKFKVWIHELHDYARVYLGKDYLGSVSRNDQDPSVDTREVSWSGEDLHVIVESMGHVNYGTCLLDRKGILGGVTYGQQRLFHWVMQTFHVENSCKLPFEKGLKAGEYGLTALRGHFRAQGQESCFIHIPEGVKGFIFVNGFNLGRYWNIGPQLDLFCPGSILKEDNEIVILESEGVVPSQIVINDTREWK